MMASSTALSLVRSTPDTRLTLAVSAPPAERPKLTVNTGLTGPLALHGVLHAVRPRDERRIDELLGADHAQER